MDTHNTSNRSLFIIFATSFAVAMAAAYADKETESLQALTKPDIVLTCLLISLFSFFVVAVVSALRIKEGLKYLTITGSVFALSSILIFLSGAENMTISKAITLNLFYSVFLSMVYFISRSIDTLLHGKKDKQNAEAINNP